MFFYLSYSSILAGTGASILQKAEIRLINQTVCNQLLTDQLTPRMMCVGILTGGVDACQVRQHLDLVLVIRQGDRPLLSPLHSGTSTYIYIFNINLGKSSWIQTMDRLQWAPAASCVDA